MVSAYDTRFVVGVIGNIISFGLFLSPVPTFYKICKVKSVEQFKPYPYIATVMNCMLWVFYGLPIIHPKSILVVTINGIGLVFEAIYLSIFFTHAPAHGRLKVLKYLAIEVVSMVAVVVGVLAGAHTHEKRSFIVGVLCVIFGTGMYFSPLLVMKLVIQTKSVKYMPFWLSLASFLNGVCWTIYACLYKFDIFITIPNGLGAIFGFVQLALYCWYYRSTPKEEPKSEVQLPVTGSSAAVAPGNDR